MDGQIYWQDEDETTPMGRVTANACVKDYYDYQLFNTFSTLGVFAFSLWSWDYKNSKINTKGRLSKKKKQLIQNRA